jgi:hypothetical protein
MHPRARPEMIDLLIPSAPRAVAENQQRDRIMASLSVRCRQNRITIDQARRKQTLTRQPQSRPEMIDLLVPSAPRAVSANQQRDRTMASLPCDAAKTGLVFIKSAEKDVYGAATITARCSC